MGHDPVTRNAEGPNRRECVREYCSETNDCDADATVVTTGRKYRNFILKSSCLMGNKTGRRGRVVSTCASCLGNAGFESRHTPAIHDVIVALLSLSRKMPY